MTVRLPTVLCQLTGCEPRVEVSGGTVGDALQDLVARRPALRNHLFDDAGALRRHVLCFRNGVHARGRAGLEGPLAPGDTLTIVGSVAGG